MLTRILTTASLVLTSMATGAFLAWNNQEGEREEFEPLKVGTCYTFKNIQDLGSDAYIFKIEKAAKNEKDIYVYQAWDKQIGWFAKRLDHLNPKLFIKTKCPVRKKTVRRNT